MKALYFPQLITALVPLVSSITAESYTNQTGTTYYYTSFTLPGRALPLQTQEATSPVTAFRYARQAIQTATARPTYPATVSAFHIEYLGIDSEAAFQSVPVPAPGFTHAFTALAYSPQAAYADAREYATHGYDSNALPDPRTVLSDCLTMEEYQSLFGQEPDDTCAVVLHVRYDV
ncbi:hypothetical protein [Hymenobacter sediminicola]|uniref:Uncharacterized protein n=1 Tax=Hymenobacter sediminicola TaxID=2761579 RepID=A0A7G7W772_9BACT|nr:hypothetical protein [Hymenobacter sediminicola]QNH62215.1 hypothetical protein H4317_19100 [Hymenobacter sediminicola]